MIRFMTDEPLYSTTPVWEWECDLRRGRHPMFAVSVLRECRQGVQWWGVMALKGVGWWTIEVGLWWWESKLTRVNGKCYWSLVGWRD